MPNNITTFRMFLANCTGNAKNNVYRNAVTITNEAELSAACQKDHVCAAFGDCRRKNDNYIRGYAFAADCDNDFTDDASSWITPRTVAECLPDVAFYAVKSRNCDKIKHPGETGEKSARPRYHYYFPLSVPIEGYDAARKLTDQFLLKFPMFDDEGTKPAQFFYGHAEPVAQYFPGQTDLSDYFRKNPIQMDPVHNSEVPSVPQPNFACSDDFAALNVDDMLSSISPACDYGTWVSLGMAIKSAGLPFETWDRWSRGAPDLYPGSEKMRRKWLTFKDGQISFGTLVYLAKENGWKPDPEKLTGEYKVKHEAAQYSKEQLEEFRNGMREQNIKRLAEIGIDCAGDPYKYAWKSNFDGVITEVLDKASGEIIFRIQSGDNSNQEQPIQGVTIHTANTAAQAANKKKSRPKPTVTNYDDVEIKETDFLFYPWFPRGKITTIQGDSGSSKSTYAYAVGAKVSTGEDLLGVPCEDPGNVMFLTNEDDAGDILTAFSDSGGDTSKLFRIKERELLAQITLSDEGAKLIDEIIKKNDIKFLVLDPIQAFLDGDMNKASETRPQFQRLMNVAEENNTVIVFIQHLGKDVSKAALYRGIGSVDINASTRSVLQVVTDPNDDLYKIVFTVKNNTCAMHDWKRAIRYQIKDHPDNYDFTSKKRRHFHGHAEFVELLPDYTERQYRRATKKAEDEEMLNELKLSLDYEKEPLVITARKLIEENPSGMFIGTDDFIQKITIACGRCPYEQSKSSTTGIYSRAAKLRELLIDRDGIQIDIQSGSIYPKAYNWHGELEEPEHVRTKGFKLTPVKASSEGYQQTKI